MTDPDSTVPSDATLPDTAMATGNDEGELGQSDARPLAKDERKLLKKLQKPADGEAHPVLEDGPEVAAAVADDSPLALADAAGGNPDGLDPQFTDR